MARPKLRFGLKVLLLLILVACIALAVYVRPSYYAMATVDIQPNPTAAPIKGEIRATVCALMKSSHIVKEAIAASPDSQKLLQNVTDPQQWVRDRIDTIPIGEDGLMEIRIRGEPNEKEALEVVLSVLISQISHFLSEATIVTKNPNVAAFSLDPNVEIKSGWGPARKTWK